MPELPEVETVRRQLDPRVKGARIVDAGSHPSSKFTPATEAIGASIVSTGRRAKFLLLQLDDDRELVVHLGMTGVLRFRDGPPNEEDPYLRAWWTLMRDDDIAQTLEFADVRRFGRLRVVPTGDYSGMPTLANAGPEPWDPILTPKLFWQLLQASKRPIKTQLLSQRPIAGVGNIYADEALWIAEINPTARRIGLERAAKLLDAVRSTLEQGIELGGTTLRDYRNAEGGTGGNQHELFAYGRSGKPCLRCGTTMEARVIDARTTTWCKTCQRR